MDGSRCALELASRPSRCARSRNATAWRRLTCAMSHWLALAAQDSHGEYDRVRQAASGYSLLPLKRVAPRKPPPWPFQLWQHCRTAAWDLPDVSETASLGWGQTLLQVE